MFCPLRSEYEYELQLRYDLYTEKHTQWFYFRIQNMRKGIKYRFTITNLIKVRWDLRLCEAEYWYHFGLWGNTMLFISALATWGNYRFWKEHDRTTYISTISKTQRSPHGSPCEPHSHLAIVEKRVAQRFTNGSPTVYQRFTNGLPTVYQRFTNGLPTVYQRFTNGLPTVYQRFTNGLPTVYQRFTNGLPTVYQRFTNGLPTVYQRFTKRFTNDFNIPCYLLNTLSSPGVCIMMEWDRYYTQKLTLRRRTLAGEELGITSNIIRTISSKSKCNCLYPFSFCLWERAY